MTINRIGPLDSINKLNKSEKVQANKNLESGDSIKVSKSAIDKAELFKASSIAKNSPDIRADKVAEVMKKLQDPNYINSKVIDSVV